MTALEQEVQALTQQILDKVLGPEFA